jgi:short-subunit dehydrogenase
MSLLPLKMISNPPTYNIANIWFTRISASGLGRATVQELVKAGGHAAILDMNSEAGEAFAKELGGSARFWECDVTDTENVAACVEGIVAWAKESGAPLGGVVPAAGVGNPALVCYYPFQPKLKISSLGTGAKTWFCEWSVRLTRGMRGKPDAG